MKILRLMFAFALSAFLLYVLRSVVDGVMLEPYYFRLAKMGLARSLLPIYVDAAAAAAIVAIVRAHGISPAEIIGLAVVLVVLGHLSAIRISYVPTFAYGVWIAEALVGVFSSSLAASFLCEEPAEADSPTA